MSSTHNAELDGDIFFASSKVNKNELLVTTDELPFKSLLFFEDESSQIKL
jgi:hypothetical protein